MNYNLQYFIDKFEAIPEEKWTTCAWKNGNRYCAQGHCMSDETIEYLMNKCSPVYIPPKDELDTILKESYALSLIFNNSAKRGYKKVVEINNGTDYDYQQDTPKQRILAALYDIKSLQALKQAEDIVNSPAQLVL